jgi:hypothetical protein
MEGGPLIASRVRPPRRRFHLSMPQMPGFSFMGEKIRQWAGLSLESVQAACELPAPLLPLPAQDGLVSRTTACASARCGAFLDDHMRWWPCMR